MPRPPSTRPPPPPDPIDAAEEALARMRKANNRFAEADDFADNTGRFDAPHFHVHVDPPARERLPSVTEADIPKTHSMAGTVATVVAAAVAALVARLLKLL